MQKLVWEKTKGHGGGKEAIIATIEGVQYYSDYLSGNHPNNYRLFVRSTRKFAKSHCIDCGIPSQKAAKSMAERHYQSRYMRWHVNNTRRSE